MAPQPPWRGAGGPKAMKSFSLLKPFVRENRFRIIAGLVSVVLVDILQLIIPRFVKYAIDDLSALNADVSGLLYYAGAIFGASLLIGFFRYIWRTSLLGTARRIEEQLRNRLFNHIQLLSASYFSQTKTGDLMAHATNDLANIRIATGMGIVALTDAVILGGAAAGFMAYISVDLTILILIPMPFIALMMRFFNRRMHWQYQQVQSTFADLTETVRERFSGIRIIKAFGMEDETCRQVTKVSDRSVSENLHLKRITGALFPLMVLLTNVSLAILLYYGGSAAIKTRISTGDFVAFISYLYLLAWPMMALGWVSNLVQRGGASLDRINVILSTRPEILDSPDSRKLPDKQGEIVLKNVSFTYKDRTEPVLSDISVQIKPGMMLGIVGAPGSGKTTLLGLIPRLYDVDAGEILINNIDIRNLRLNDLRNRIAYLSQEPFIFSGTIRNNITFGNTAHGDEDIDAVVRAASLGEDLSAMPEGLDTVVGERGVTLSGGQKQRLALARALLHDARILLLDDPISQVDAKTAAEIIHTIREYTGDKTVIIVSHRLSIMQFAERIMVLANGTIAEEGSHTELMGLNNYYAQTFRLQVFDEVVSEN